MSNISASSHGLKQVQQMNLYKKPVFSGLRLCKLVGITHHQFKSFKLAGLIENKHKYSLQDIIYVAFTNSFRLLGFDWKSILNFYNSRAFSSCNFVKNIDFFNHKMIVVSVDKEKPKTFFIPKNSVSKESIDCIDLIQNLDSLGKNIYSENRDIPCLSSSYKVNGNDLYVFYLSRIIETIIANSKKLNIRLSLEKILLFELEGKRLIG